jgi:DNA modification methylase
MYRYRALLPRLISKVKRAYRNFPMLDPTLIHDIYSEDGLALPLRPGSIDAVITSPPYMDNLDYVRDNRLRLWFLGLEERYLKNQEHFSPDEFRAFLIRSLLYFKRVLKDGGLCVLVLGNINRDQRHYQCARLAKHIALTKLGLFRLHEELKYPLPENRRSRHYRRGTTSETILVLESRR